MHGAFKLLNRNYAKYARTKLPKNRCSIFAASPNTVFALELIAPSTVLRSKFSRSWIINVRQSEKSLSLLCWGGAGGKNSFSYSNSPSAIIHSREPGEKSSHCQSTLSVFSILVTNSQTSQARSAKRLAKKYNVKELRHSMDKNRECLIASFQKKKFSRELCRFMATLARCGYRRREILRLKSW